METGQQQFSKNGAYMAVVKFSFAFMLVSMSTELLMNYCTTFFGNSSSYFLFAMSLLRGVFGIFPAPLLQKFFKIKTIYLLTAFFIFGSVLMITVALFLKENGYSELYTNILLVVCYGVVGCLMSLMRCFAVVFIGKIYVKEKCMNLYSIFFTIWNLAIILSSLAGVMFSQTKPSSIMTGFTIIGFSGFLLLWSIHDFPFQSNFDSTLFYKNIWSLCSHHVGWMSAVLWSFLEVFLTFFATVFMQVLPHDWGSVIGWGWLLNSITGCVLPVIVGNISLRRSFLSAFRLGIVLTTLCISVLCITLESKSTGLAKKALYLLTMTLMGATLSAVDTCSFTLTEFMAAHFRLAMSPLVQFCRLVSATVGATSSLSSRWFYMYPQYYVASLLVVFVAVMVIAWHVDTDIHPLQERSPGPQTSKADGMSKNTPSEVLGKKKKKKKKKKSTTTMKEI